MLRLHNKMASFILELKKKKTGYKNAHPRHQILLHADLKGPEPCAQQFIHSLWMKEYSARLWSWIFCLSDVKCIYIYTTPKHTEILSPLVTAVCTAFYLKTVTTFERDTYHCQSKNCIQHKKKKKQFDRSLLYTHRTQHTQLTQAQTHTHRYAPLLCVAVQMCTLQCYMLRSPNHNERKYIIIVILVGRSLSHCCVNIST